jgi:hypothetical protein
MHSMSIRISKIRLSLDEPVFAARYPACIKSPWH